MNMKFSLDTLESHHKVPDGKIIVLEGKNDKNIFN